MTAANFRAELGDELLFEGGFVDDPQDPGGITDFGITLHTLSHFTNHAASVQELKAMTDAMKAAIYRAMFWNVVNADNLPGGIDLEVFDMAVNGGPATAARLLQHLLAGVGVDGAIGQITLRAVAAYPTGIAGLVGTYARARRLFYRQSPNFPRYGSGWMNRVDRCQVLALGLVQ